MFIHHVIQTGRGSRGAWPWRRPSSLSSWLHGARRAPAAP